MRWRIALALIALVLLVAPLPPGPVERYYSTGLFPVVQALLTRASNLTAAAWFDLLVIAVIVLLVATAWRDLARHRRLVALRRLAVRVITTAAAIVVWFAVTWGLNYQRESLRQKVPFDPARITPDAAVALARETVTHANATYGAAHAAGWGPAGDVPPALRASFAEAARTLRLPPDIVPGRPKRTRLFDLYFRRAGVAGMTDPFFLETLVASDTLPFERPHVVAHEWAHLAGVTDEGEANFVAWLACIRGAVEQQYSGWLFLYTEVTAALPRTEAQRVVALLDPGPRADLEAIRRRALREVSPRLSRAGWQVYDQYLRANRVEAGTASYAEVVQLVLGTEIR